MELEELNLSVRSAYLKARSHIYYDKRNLHNRNIFAEFEASVDKDAKLLELATCLLDPNPLGNKKIIEWLAMIKTTVMPKHIEVTGDPCEEGFLSNVDIGDSYQCHNVNYFINCPIQIHIISALWIMTAGVAIDSKLSDDCYGYRLHPQASDISSRHLFEFYVKQYTKWRDQAIALTRRTVSEDKQQATLLGLDIKEFYYHATVKWNLLEKDIAAYFSHCEGIGSRLLSDANFALKMTGIIRGVCDTYGVFLKDKTSITHSLPKGTNPLPLEITFSPIISNWLLKSFDRDVRKNLSPVYYGRYVDDFLFVISSSAFFADRKIEDAPAEATGGIHKKNFLSHYFVDRNLFNTKDSKSYVIKSSPEFKIQPDKINLFFFDPSGSLGALERFSKNIRRIASEFRFLPEVFPVHEIESLSFSLSYNGGTNGLRNLKGFDVDKWELSKLLASAAATRLYISDRSKIQIEAESIERLFKGVSGLCLYDMWERAFAILVLGEQYKHVREFYWNRRRSIDSLTYGDSDSFIAQQIREGLENHLNASLAMSLSIAVDIESGSPPWKKVWASRRDFEASTVLRDLVNNFKESNLTRHQYVASPLLNFTDDRGDWTRSFAFWPANLELNPDRISASPRHIHEEEFMHAAWMSQSLDFPRKIQEKIDEWSCYFTI